MAYRRRTFSSGSSSWEVYWRNPLTGKREQAYVASLQEARKLNSEIRHRLEFDRASFSPKAQADQPSPSQRPTVQGIVYSYLRARKLSPKNLKHTLSHLKACLEEIGNVEVEELSKRQLKAMIAALAERGLKQNGINRKVSIIKAALAWAEEEEVIESNPAASFKCPRGEDERNPPPTPAELRRILAVAPAHVTRALLLAFSLGVRVGPSELFRIEWDGVDLERRKVRLRTANKNRGEQWRELDLTAELSALLARWGDEDEWTGPLIHYRGQPIKSMKGAWATALAAAGITRKIRPYDLRHAFATYALDAGSDPGSVAQVMGHTSTAMIHKHYQHVLDRQRRQVMESLPSLCATQPRHTDEEFSADFRVARDKNSQLKQ